MAYSCNKGLATFEQQNIDVAEAKRMRRHQQRNPLPPKTRGQGSACTVCGCVYASAFGLRSHMRQHKEHAEQRHRGSDGQLRERDSL